MPHDDHTPPEDRHSAREFRLLKVVGQGAFGTVYRATQHHDHGFEKTVAIKMLHPRKVSPEVLQRFRDEARILALLRDRAIVKVDPPIRIGERWGVVMEFVDGASVRRLLQQHGVLPPRIALEIIGEIARALDNAVHQPGPDGSPLRLIHRDLKPDNIQVTRSGEVRILDFGIARADFEAREAHTTAGLVGTPGYIAPERFNGVEDPRGDIYSLGGVLHEMVASTLPGASALEPAADTLAMAAVGLALRMRGTLEQRPNAREVDLDVANILERHPGEERLREWAERWIPQESGTQADDDMIGQVLSEVIHVANPPPLITIGADAVEPMADPDPVDDTLFALLAERGAMPAVTAVDVVRRVVDQLITRGRTDAMPLVSLDTVRLRADGEVELVGATTDARAADPLQSIGTMLVGLLRGYPMLRAYEDPGPLPAEVEPIIDACLGTDVRRATLEELSAALAEAKLSLENPNARPSWDAPPPPPPPKRVNPWPWRLRVAALVAALVAVIPVFGVGLTTFQLHQAARAHDAAHQALLELWDHEQPLRDELAALGSPLSDDASAPVAQRVDGALSAIRASTRDSQRHEALVLRQRAERLERGLLNEQNAANTWVARAHGLPGRVVIGLGLAPSPDASIRDGS
jgi:serine/threonine protein kinase